MKILILLISLLLINCKKNNNEIEIDSQIINEITKAIVLEECFNILKTEKETVALSEELIKVEISIPEKRNSNKSIPPPPPFFNRISIAELLNTKIENKLFFSSKDSLYLLQQNMYPPKFNIDKKMFSEINLTTVEKEINKKKINKSYNFYEISIPILSLDNKKAYVLLNHYCGNLCGNGRVLFLKKLNGNWKIIKTRKTWVS